MAAQPRDITFLVPGQAVTADQPSTRGRAGGIELATELRGTVKSAVRVSVQRGAGPAARVTARPGDDIIVLEIANGPILYLHPEHARELLRAQVGAVSAMERGVSAPAEDGEVIVPARLSWRGLNHPSATRGGEPAGFGDAQIEAVKVLTGFVKDKAAKIIAAEATKKIDGQVDPGVYKLSADELPRLKDHVPKVTKIQVAADGGPILVLAHGTFVDTSSTFRNLWSYRTRVENLFNYYGGRVYALDHPTVGASPIANALTLAETLPTNARLHLVTHSRGGLVAEVLARVAGGHGLRAEDFFKGTDYTQHRADLAKLVEILNQRSIRIERMVRVACPARGTLLASRRLDAYLSVFKWSLQLAGVPVVPEIVDFLAEIAMRRTDPVDLPGLEAMMPDQPFAKWLNASGEAVPGDLRVIAGDIKGDSFWSWVKALVADAFYWTDNDLVVQTRSMYGGTPRDGGSATFVLDRGGSVTHFNYFANERTANAIVDGLLRAQPDGFRPIGPLSWAGEDAGGTRAARAALRSQTGNANARPAVFVLPGILGSHLKVDGRRVWLSFRFFNSLDRLKWDPGTADGVQPDGPIGMSYDDLIEHLADTHEVVPFSFDWRRPIEDEARRLAEAIDKTLAAREATRQPVRIVAHSMGGLVARAMQLERPETWTRMMAREGARVLMLGTPNGGS
jgi:pimeloyl-ACP methyl ester carboxylesterase